MKAMPNNRVEPTRDTAHRFLLSRGRAAHAERYAKINLGDVNGYLYQK